MVPKETWLIVVSHLSPRYPLTGILLRKTTGEGSPRPGALVDYMDNEEPGVSLKTTGYKNHTWSGVGHGVEGMVRLNTPSLAKVASSTMNIDVIGRIRPPIRAEGSVNLVVEGHRVAAKHGGPYVNLRYLHKRDADNYDIFKHNVEGLLDSFMMGYNACLLVMGQSDSGKSYTMSGESTNKTGIVPMIFDYLFTRLTEDKYMFDTQVQRQKPLVTLQMYEIYNELIKDLLQQPGVGGAFLDLSESQEKGVFIKHGSEIGMRDSSMAQAQYRQGLARRTEATTDFGPAQRNAALLVQIDLQMSVGENPQPNKSRFTVVELPGLEKLAEDPSDLRQREGPALSKSLLGLKQLVTTLSSNPYPDRVISYSESKLTHLLREELGGNCMTKAVLCLKPASDPNALAPALTFATRVSQVKNFPIVNDSFAQSLLTQYRAKIIDLQQQSGVGPASMAKVANVNDVKETIHQLETENLRLRDDNERLRNRLDGIQNKFGSLADTKTDLSHQLLMTEEEKLKVSQSLVEMQIENNKIREEAEANKFELTNKILMLENSLIDAETEREKQKKSARNARERLSELERDRKDLADEYVVLKTNYLALVRESEKEATRNEELSIELLNLVNAKAALMQQVHALTDGSRQGDPQAEIDRVKALVIKNSSGKIKADEILGTQKDREAVEKTLFASRKRFEGDIEKMRKEHKEEQQKLDTKINDMQKDAQDYRNLARERQHKVAELNAVIMNRICTYIRFLLIA
ncbi:hypothetical protein ScPMuIL_000233 [Solemya velum]